jgi:hypothetical protein
VYAREDQPDAAFEETSAAGAEADFACFAEERDMARTAVGGASLDEQFTYRGHGPYSLRWLYNHMIERSTPGTTATPTCSGSASTGPSDHDGGPGSARGSGPG